MEFTFDPAKDAGNIVKHGVSLSMAAEMDMAEAVIVVDDRLEYGEDRLCAFGMMATACMFWSSLSGTARGERSACARRTGER